MVFFATSGADPRSAGERAGALFAAPLLAGLAVGIWARLEHRRWHVLDYVLRFVVCTVVLYALNAAGNGLVGAVSSRETFNPVPLTDAEKQGLYMSGGWANHRDLGFVLPLGGQWDTDSAVQNGINNQLANLRGTFAWALRNPRTDEIAVIYVMKGVETSEADFRAMARGISRGIEKQGVQVREDAIQWSSRAKEFRHAARLPEGLHAKTRCVPSDSKRIPYIICVQTLSPDSAGLDDARNHLKITAWK